MPILNKKGLKSNTTSKGIAKRIKWINQFLEELTKEAIFKSTTETLIFLTMDKESFDKTKNELSKLPEPKMVSEIPHLDGKANIKVVESKITFLYNINKYYAEVLSLYDKLRSNNVKIVDTMKNLCLLLVSQAEIYKNLAVLNINIKVFISAY